MSKATERATQIVAAHTVARTAVGITGATRKTITPGSAPTRVDVDRQAETERARDRKRQGETAQRAEVVRLNARIKVIRDAERAADRDGDDERAARLGALAEAVALRVAVLTDATFNRPATLADWMPKGRFTNYARRYDLGFIQWDADDIAMEAFELLTLERNSVMLCTPHQGCIGADHGEGCVKHGRPPLLTRGEPTDDGSATAGHTIGDGYRAIKRVYRRGLGFYGYERRGTVVERDNSPRGYHPAESHTVEMLRLRGEDESTIRASLIALGNDAPLFPYQETIDGVEAPGMTMRNDDEYREVIAVNEQLEVVARRRRGLETLAHRFPLNADGRMLALASLLAEGFTFEETCQALGIAGRTAERWARELANVA